MLSAQNAEREIVKKGFANLDPALIAPKDELIN